MFAETSLDLVAQPLNTRSRQAIRAEMARRGFNQAQLANALGHGQAWLSWRLTGRTPLALADVESIAAILRVPIGILLPIDEPAERRRRAS